MAKPLSCSNRSWKLLQAKFVNQNMKKPYKTAMLAALGLASVSTVQAATYPAGDLILGFTTGTGNDLIYDLGQESSLVNGKTWNLSSLLAGYSNLNNLNWGVIGNGVNSGTPRTAWTTTATGITPNTVTGNTAFGKLNTAVGSIYSNFSAAGAGQSLVIAANDVTGLSWNTETLNGALTTDYLNAYENPNVMGLTSDSFWKVLNDGSAPTLLGSFTLAANGVVTFNLVSTAPPPVPRMVAITRSGNSSTVFFTTTNGTFTYSLCYTNSSGLTASVTNWPSLPTTVIGNGLTNSLADTTTDSNRFYRVTVH